MGNPFRVEMLEIIIVAWGCRNFDISVAMIPPNESPIRLNACEVSMSAEILTQ
jgi:hypothetical protein